MVRIHIEGTDLPGRSCGPSPDRPGGHQNIHVGVQRRNKPDEWLELQPGDAESVERLRERTDDAVLRAAGGTTLLDANVPPQGGHQVSEKSNTTTRFLFCGVCACITEAPTIKNRAGSNKRFIYFGF